MTDFVFEAAHMRRFLFLFGSEGNGESVCL